MYDRLISRLDDRSARICIVGLGYVGLPLAVAAAAAGYQTVGFDVDSCRVADIIAGRSNNTHVPSSTLLQFVDQKRLKVVSSPDEQKECDVVVICVPTPLTSHQEPDLSFLESATGSTARNLRRGQLVVIESTSFPGTTRSVVKPILDHSGLVCGQDYFLGYSPEREDPGNTSYRTQTITKLVAGIDEPSREAIRKFYGDIVNDVATVRSVEVAESAKIVENVFRFVNIGLVNELKMLFDDLGIDVWEVIEAAATKPFGFMPFYPGPGIGGHCIPIDPLYMAWAARATRTPTRLIDLAAEINSSMPRYVLHGIARGLNDVGRPLNGARVFILGIAYKKNVGDCRESPALPLIGLLESAGASVTYSDPFVPSLDLRCLDGSMARRASVDLTESVLASADVVVVITDHDGVDYEFVSRHSRMVVDTRNVMARCRTKPNHLLKT